jgi:hypothetical protein
MNNTLLSIVRINKLLLVVVRRRMALSNWQGGYCMLLTDDIPYSKIE